MPCMGQSCREIEHPEAEAQQRHSSWRLFSWRPVIVSKAEIFDAKLENLYRNSVRAEGPFKWEEAL